MSTGVTLGLGTLCFIKISTSSCLAKQRADSLKVLANCANAVALYSLSSSLVKIIQAIHARHYLNVAKYSLGLYLSVKLGGIGELIYTTAHSFAEKKRMIMLPKYLKRKNLFNRNDIEKPKDPRHPLNCKVLKRGMININTYVHNKQFKSLITKVTKLIGTILPSKNKQSRSVTDLLSSCNLIYNEDEVRPKKKQAKRAQDAISVWLSGSYYKFIDESVKLRQRLCGTDSLESM